MKKLLISEKCTKRGYRFCDRQLSQLSETVKGWTVMVIVKLIIRILLLPVRISLTIVQLVVMFITWLSATVFHILSGIICITAILGYGFGQEIKQ